MLELRDFDASDAPRVGALLTAIGWEPRYIQGQLGSLGALHVDPNGRVLVAVDGAEVMGYVTVLFAPWNRLAQVHGLAVAPGFQRRGVASALLGAAEAFVRQRG